MMKFRKKPVVIEAVQFVGNFNEIEAFCGGDAEIRNGKLLVATLEGPLTASPNDWIIKGVKGEFYPCKPDIFAATYEAVNGGIPDLTYPLASTEGMVGVPPISSEIPSRDWTEDADHENGKYENTCHACRKTFIGHKRRMVCRLCYATPPSETDKGKAVIEAARRVAESYAQGKPLHYMLRALIEALDPLAPNDSAKETPNER